MVLSRAIFGEGKHCSRLAFLPHFCWLGDRSRFTCNARHRHCVHPSRVI
jgi:hypothetical protein